MIQKQCDGWRRRSARGADGQDEIDGLWQGSVFLMESESGYLIESESKIAGESSGSGCMRAESRCMRAQSSSSQSKPSTQNTAFYRDVRN